MSNSNQKGTALLGGALTEEVLESSDSILSAGTYGQGIKGLQQFYSPPEMARLAHAVIGSDVCVLDPTAGDGSLLKEFSPAYSFGIEIDHDQIKAAEGGYQPLKGDFQHFYTLLKLGMSGWPAIVANPPFGLKWDDPTIRDGKPTNSTVMTFIMLNRLLADDGQFIFICGQGRHERQLKQLSEYSTVYAVIECDDMFEGTREPNAIIFGLADPIRSLANPGVLGTRKVNRDMLDLCGDWVKGLREEALDSYSRVAYRDYNSYRRVEEFKSIQAEYDRRLEGRIKNREFDAQLYNGNHVQWYPSAFAQLSLQQAGIIHDFNGLNGQPVAYFAQNERLWFKLVNAEHDGLIRVDPRLHTAVSSVLGDIHRIRVPLYDLKPQQRLGFLTDVDSLLCIKDDEERRLKKGERYRLDTQTKTIIEKEERVVESKKNPGEYDLKTFEKQKKVMSITLSGGGAHFSIYDGGEQASQNIAWLVSHFEIPEAPPVEKKHPEEIAALEALVRETLNEFAENSAEWEKENPVSMPFTVREFQVRDIARMLFKEFGLLAWEQGLGKTVGALAFYRAATKLRAKEKLLITTAGDLKDQWTRECERFLGVTPTVITTHGQAHRIARHLRTGGTGVYIAHYEALSVNGTLRKNQLLPVITVKEWKERQLVRGTDKYGNWLWWRESDDTKISPYAVEHLLKAIGVEELDVDFAHPKEDDLTIMEGYGFVQRAVRDYYGPQGVRNGYGYIRPRWEEVTKKLTSKDICPQCQADTRNGWGGTFCEALDYAGQKCGYAHYASKVKPIASLLSTAFHDGVAVLDEITYIQGNDSKRSKAMRGIQARYRLGLTGTPIKNYVDQVFWPLAWCLGYSKPWFPYDYSGGRTRFENDFCVIEHATNGRRKEQRKVLPDVTNLSRFWRMLASCTIRRRAEETGEPLVDIWYHEINVPVSVGQAEQNREWLKKMPHGFPALFKEKYPDHKVVAAGMQDILAPLLGLNWKLDYTMTVPEADPDVEWTGIEVNNWTPGNLRTLELTMALVQQGRKVLVGSHIVGAGQWIAERLQEKGVNAVHIVDDSGTTVEAKKRAQRVYSFQTDEDVQVFCAGMKAIRLGHNLDAANAVVLNGLDFDYETFDQFIKRVRRLTSKQDVDVFVILPTLAGQQTITTRKWQLLGLKGNAADLALDGRLISKNEQEISEADMIRELQERGFTVTDEAVDQEDIEAAWKATAMIEDFEGEGIIPARPDKPEPEETEETEETVEQTDTVPDVVPDELVVEQAVSEMDEYDPIEEAEAELAALEADVAAGEDEGEFVGDHTEDISHKLDDEFPGMNDMQDSVNYPETREEWRESSDGVAIAVIPVEPEESSSAGDDPEPDDDTVPAEDDAAPVEEAAAPDSTDIEDDQLTLLTEPDGDPLSPPAPALDPMAQLKQAKELHELGVLSDEEFAAVKANMLAALGVTA